LIKNIVAENQHPFWMGKGLLLITGEQIDGFLKFKRYMFRFDGSDFLTLLLLKIYFRFGREKAFCI